MHLQFTFSWKWVGKKKKHIQFLRVVALFCTLFEESAHYFFPGNSYRSWHGIKSKQTFFYYYFHSTKYYPFDSFMLSFLPFESLVCDCFTVKECNHHVKNAYCSLTQNSNGEFVITEVSCSYFEQQRVSWHFPHSHCLSHLWPQ